MQSRCVRCLQYHDNDKPCQREPRGILGMHYNAQDLATADGQTITLHTKMVRGKLVCNMCQGNGCPSCFNTGFSLGFGPY